jgi:hypothetical protein
MIAVENNTISNFEVGWTARERRRHENLKPSYGGGGGGNGRSDENSTQSRGRPPQVPSPIIEYTQNMFSLKQASAPQRCTHRAAITRGCGIIEKLHARSDHFVCVCVWGRWGVGWRGSAAGTRSVLSLCTLSQYKPPRDVSILMAAPSVVSVFPHLSKIDEYTAKREFAPATATPPLLVAGPPYSVTPMNWSSDCVSTLKCLNWPTPDCRA